MAGRVRGGKGEDGTPERKRRPEPSADDGKAPGAA